MRTFRSRMNDTTPAHQPAEHSGSLGWTKQELMDAGGLSAKTFDTIRKAARVKGPSHGGLTHVFGVEDLISLTKKAGGGTFTERGAPAAKAWKALLAQAGVQFDG